MQTTHPRPRRAGRPLLTLLVVLGLGAPVSAHANGNHTHIGISLMAIELLPAGPLRTLLEDPSLRPMLLNGTIFPDGGYAVKHDYGETAHWEPFQRALATRIRTACPDPLASQACREKAAFLFGMASHGMADQVFDALFMSAAKVHDKENWSDGLTDSFDSSTDVLWVAAHGGLEPPARWLPMDDLLPTFAALGVQVDAGTIEDGQAVLLTAVLGFGNVSGKNPKKVEEAKARYPWGAAHLDDPLVPGSPPSEARVVASYWQQLWAEWKDGKPATVEVLATMPGGGGAGIAAQASDPGSGVAVVFSRGLDAKSLDSAKLTATAQGSTTPHTCTVNLFYGQSSHVVRLLPKQDWPGASLTLAWSAGFCSSFDGIAQSDSGAVEVRVGPADPAAPAEALPGAPPPSWSLYAAPAAGDASGTDAVDQADGSGPAPMTTATDTGCSAHATPGSHNGPFSLLLALLALGLYPRRRRAGKPS